MSQNTVVILEVFNGPGVFGYLTVSNWLKVSVPQIREYS